MCLRRYCEHATPKIRRHAAHLPMKKTARLAFFLQNVDVLASHKLHILISGNFKYNTITSLATFSIF